MINISTALVKAQSEMVTPKKGNVNPFFKNKYADLNSILEAVMPAFHNNGISILQPIVHIDGKNFVKTLLLHESGEFLESFTEIIYNKINDAQAQGSGITYARRYGLQSFVNVGADDDDGKGAVAKNPYTKTESEQTKTEPTELDWTNLATLFELKKEKLDADKFDPVKKAVFGKNPKYYEYTLSTLNKL